MDFVMQYLGTPLAGDEAIALLWKAKEHSYDVRLAQGDAEADRYLIQALCTISGLIDAG